MNLVKNTLLILVMLSCFYNLAHADSEIMIKGNNDCGMWASARKTKQSGEFEALVLGYINGYAVGTNMDIWRTGQNPMSADQANLWVDKYCAQNPLSSPFDGVYYLFQEILSK